MNTICIIHYRTVVNLNIIQVDRAVAKLFGKKLFRGVITHVKFDDEGVLYRVAYEDGDWEELDHRECYRAVGLHDKIEVEEIDEWELGEE